MSLAIDLHNVDAILLPDGKWYAVADKSFAVDTYEFTQEGKAVVGGGSSQGVPLTGAMWKDNMGKRFACPLTAILAIRMHG